MAEDSQSNLWAEKYRHILMSDTSPQNFKYALLKRICESISKKSVKKNL